MGYPDTFEGFTVDSPKTWNKFKRMELKQKPFGDSDIDVEIECCVCDSDVHTITGGWWRVECPLCVGHEIVGKAIRMGKNVKTIKEGHRVGVGAQIWARLKCVQLEGRERELLPLSSRYA
jgi:alcohol dehydrogenase (NADP+)